MFAVTVAVAVVAAVAVTVDVAVAVTVDFFKASAVTLPSRYHNHADFHQSIKAQQQQQQQQQQLCQATVSPNEDGHLKTSRASQE